MIVSKTVPVLPYVFLACVICLPAFKYYLLINQSVVVFQDDDDPSPFDFSTTYLMFPETSADFTLLVLVTTMASEVELRQQVRLSWANTTRTRRARVEFLMGRPTASEMHKLQKEQEIFNDLIIADLTESYYGLASKTISMLTYKMRYHPRSKCLVKADIDNVLILDNYLRLCEETVAPLILGKCDVTRTVKRNETKWAIPMQVWPYPLFPAYCSTGTYMMAGETLPQMLVNQAMTSKFASSSNFRKLSEDVLVSGILADAAGVKRRHLSGLSFFEIPEFICRNSYLQTFSIHLLRDKNPVKYYRKIMQIEGKLCNWWDIFGYRRR
ncbi:unnamed protein product [Caenorhabditis angaria]|uniref:Hexosyltransferase n=1 Tax=Caenorhabditis angaria TaxID=860376 RepID=A0A9P1N5K7_9PELO|nr:unnamed protein product [Caenorhabditis angaria]